MLHILPDEVRTLTTGTHILDFKFKWKLQFFFFYLIPKAFFSDKNHCWYGCWKNTPYQGLIWKKCHLNDGPFSVEDLKPLVLKTPLVWKIKPNYGLNLIFNEGDISIENNLLFKFIDVYIFHQSFLSIKITDWMKKKLRFMCSHLSMNCYCIDAWFKEK